MKTRTMAMAYFVAFGLTAAPFAAQEDTNHDTESVAKQRINAVSSPAQLAKQRINSPVGSA